MTLRRRLRRQRPIHDRALDVALDSRGQIHFPRETRAEMVPTRSRVSSGAIKLRAILRGCGVDDDAFSHQSNRFQERRASLRAQLLGRRNRRRRNRRRARTTPRESFDLLLPSQTSSTTGKGETRSSDAREREREREKKTSNRGAIAMMEERALRLNDARLSEKKDE